MKTLLPWVVGVMLLSPGIGSGQEWHLVSAPCRFRLEKARDSSWPAEAGTVEVWPCGVDPLRYYTALFSAGGRQVSTQILWNEAHGPTQIQFNAAGKETVYYLYLDKNPPPATAPWKPEAGVVLETRRGAKLPANNWGQASRIVSSANPVYGRSLVPNVFLGANPHGPSTYYSATFRGFFNVVKAGEYGFATVSDDASFLWVDERMVTQWPGTHTAGAGRLAQHSGKISLGPGIHRLDYVQIQFDGPSAAVTAWKPPGQARFEVMPPTAFLPVAKFQIAAFEPGPALRAELVYVEWRNVAHSRVDDLELVDVQFKVLDPRKGRSYRWTFDDGAVASGANPVHCYAGSRTRKVILEILAAKTVVATNTLTVKVEPFWSQSDDWRRDIFERQKKELLARDLSGTPRDELIEMANLADRVDAIDLLGHVGNACLRRPSEFNAAHAQVFHRIGFNLVRQGHGNKEDEVAEKALRLANSLSASNPSLNEKVKLGLAELLIRGAGEIEEGLGLLRAIGARLSAEEKRLQRLLEGDALLARGQVAEAKALYHSVTNRTEKTAVKPELQRRARLEYAHSLIGRGELAAGEEILEEIVSDQPTERLSLEVHLPLLTVYLARQQYRRAASLGRRLLPVAADDPLEPELLLALATADLALKQPAAAGEVLQRLQTAYPASEAAARAKDHWNAQRFKATKAK